MKKTNPNGYRVVINCITTKTILKALNIEYRARYDFESKS